MGHTVQLAKDGGHFLPAISLNPLGARIPARNDIDELMKKTLKHSQIVKSLRNTAKIVKILSSFHSSFILYLPQLFARTLYYSILYNTNMQNEAMFRNPEAKQIHQQSTLTTVTVQWQQLNKTIDSAQVSIRP
uniref:Uncharacterized protein n=1 Tax=Sphaerodactylus townsendi TaxID=933632 RepID=A0ACB8G485_9SAUR